MRIARAIICFLAAWSIAAAPVIAGYAPAWAGIPVGQGAQHDPAAMSDANAHHHAVMQSQAELDDADAMPCLHEEQAPAQKSADHCGSMAGCALCYATALPALHLVFAEPVTVAATLSWPPSGQVTAEGPAGPFRPPRA